MNYNFYYLNRVIHQSVMDKLSSLIFHNDLNEVSLKSNDFNEFILASYSVRREERPSVSQLSDIFKKYNCKKPGTLACLYAQELEKKAQQDNDEKFWV